MTGLDYAGDIALTSETVTDAQILLNAVESVAAAIGIVLNPTKTELVHINEPHSTQYIVTSNTIT